MAADIAGVSTLGTIVCWGIETTVGECPTTFKQLHRVNSVGEISLSPETIDASALEDLVERSVAGRTSTGGTFDLVLNITDSVKAEIEELITTYEGGIEEGKQIWFQVYSPYLADGFFTLGQPPLLIPQPAFDQNGLLTVTLPITISDYKGMLTKVPVAEA